MILISIFCLGLFLGLLTLVGGIIILIIFFVMKETPEYRAQMHWIYAGETILNVVLVWSWSTHRSILIVDTGLQYSK
jgi:hypothetical protein